jgi:hypothetical protein
VDFRGIRFSVVAAEVPSLTKVEHSESAFIDR